MKKIKLFSIIMLLAMLFSSVAYASPVQAAPPASAWCGRLSSYTSWYYATTVIDGKTTNEWKRTLYVWTGKGEPYAVSVYFDNNLVGNDQKGVQTYTGPQVPAKDGWYGYFISKTWAADPRHWNWDDDRRWEVRGCIP